MKLDQARQSIDRIDSQIVNLLNQRAKRVMEIYQHKQRANLPVFAPDRESQLLRRLQKLRQNGPLSLQALKSIYREIMSASIALQAPQRIVFFGPEGTFTHEAAREQFGSSAEYLPVRGIADVFQEVERNRADYGVAPIENSTEGVVNHTLDMFIHSEVKICAEICLRVRHNLLSRESSRSRVRRLYIHPQTLAQCRQWIDGHLQGVEIIEVASNAVAAQKAAATKASAAIASRLAAKLYGLGILDRNIEDNPDNTTRFLVLGRHFSGPSGRDKTSLMLAIKDSVGALHRILKPFATYHINLTSIESRPARQGRWNYVFFIDCLGHVEDAAVQKILTALKPVTSSLRVLGSYPRGDE